MPWIPNMPIGCSAVKAARCQSLLLTLPLLSWSMRREAEDDVMFIKPVFYAWLYKKLLDQNKPVCADGSCFDNGSIQFFFFFSQALSDFISVTMKQYTLDTVLSLEKSHFCKCFFASMLEDWESEQLLPKIIILFTRLRSTFLSNLINLGFEKKKNICSLAFLTQNIPFPLSSGRPHWPFTCSPWLGCFYTPQHSTWAISGWCLSQLEFSGW